MSKKNSHPKWFRDLPKYDKMKPKCFAGEESLACIKIDCPYFVKCKAEV